jgi:hypothetical protein
MKGSSCSSFCIRLLEGKWDTMAVPPKTKNSICCRSVTNSSYCYYQDSSAISYLLEGAIPSVLCVCVCLSSDYFFPVSFQRSVFDTFERNFIKILIQSFRWLNLFGKKIILFHVPLSSAPQHVFPVIVIFKWISWFLCFSFVYLFLKTFLCFSGLFFDVLYVIHIFSIF